MVLSSAGRRGERWHGREKELAERLAAVSAGFEEVRQRGDYSEAVVYARQAAGLVWDLPSAKELVKRLSKEADEHLRERRITLLGDA